MYFLQHIFLKIRISISLFEPFLDESVIEYGFFGNNHYRFLSRIYTIILWIIIKESKYRIYL